MSLLDELKKKEGNVDVTSSGPNQTGTLLSRFVQPSSEMPSVKVEPDKRSFFEKAKSTIGSVISGVGKFLAKTGVAASQLASSTVDFSADFLASQIESNLKNTPLVGIGGVSLLKDQPARTEAAAKWRDFYNKYPGTGTEKLKEVTDNLSQLDYIKPSEAWSKASIKEKFTTRLPETVFNIGPGIISSLGAFAINPTFGFVVSSGSTADEINTIAQNAGVPKEKAELLGLGTGLVVGFLDKVVPDEILSQQEKKLFIGALAKKVAVSGLKETSTEMVQEGVQMLVEATLRTDLKFDEVKTRLIMAGFGGFLGGTSMQGLVGFVNNIRSGDIADIKPEDIKVEPTEETTAEIKTEPGKREVIRLDKTQYEGIESGMAIVRPDKTASLDVRFTKEAQGKGQGTKAVSTLENTLLKKGITMVQINSFPEAVGFWEKMGYKATQEVAKDQNVPMSKFLEATNIAKVKTEAPETITEAKITPEIQPLVKEAKKYENIDDFIQAVKGGKTQYGEYNPKLRESIPAGYQNISELGVDSEEMVTIYRGIDDISGKVKREINDGDFVTTDYDSALSYTGGPKDVVEKQVKAKYLYNSEPKDFIDDPFYVGSEYIYTSKNTNQLPSDEELKNIYNQAKGKEVKKAIVVPTREQELKPVTEEQVKNVKTIKDVKTTLKNINQQLHEAVTEAEGKAVVAQEQRAGLNTDNIAKLKKILAINKTFQEGDIETIRASKTGTLLNTVIENVQEIHPNMSEQEAFDFAKNLPTKAEETGKVPGKRDMEQKAKDLRNYLDLLKSRQEELKIKEDSILSKEWQDAIAVQENLERIVKVPESQLPITSEGKEKVSRLEARMKGVLENATQEQIDALGLTTYNQVNNKENIAMAAEYVTDNTDEAIQVLKGEIDPPKGILRNAVYIALKSLGAVDTDLATKLASLASTRYGQEISILREIEETNPVTMMEDLVKTRIEAYEKKTGRKLDDRVKTEVEKISKEIKVPDGQAWDSFLNEILC